LRAINGTLARQMMLGVLIFGVSPGVLSSSVSAQEHRSSAVAREFQRENPCPSTGQTSGACPGYIKDHIKPLACGGPDDPANIQWQTVEAAKAKDKTELKDCARDELAGYQKGHPGGHDPNGIVLRGSSNATREQVLRAEHPE
jgi:hypothetical protein